MGREEGGKAVSCRDGMGIHCFSVEEVVPVSNNSVQFDTSRKAFYTMLPTARQCSRCGDLRAVNVCIFLFEGGGNKENVFDALRMCQKQICYCTD